MNLLILQWWAPLWVILLSDLHILCSGCQCTHIEKFRQGDYPTFVYLPTGMGVIWPGFFILRRLLVQKIVYLLPMASHMYPLWSDWDSGELILKTLYWWTLPLVSYSYYFIPTSFGCCFYRAYLLGVTFDSWLNAWFNTDFLVVLLLWRSFIAHP